jgi:Uri superfamily endonuclease
MRIPSIRIIGDDSQAGTYILRIRLNQDTALQFGRFKKGKLISLPAGDYIYIGSALSERGSTSLARRLIRHATRSNDKPPHAIRGKLIKRCLEHRLGPRDLLPKRRKTLYWNIDFLLDLQSAEIVNILAIRSPERLENRIAKRLEHDPHTEIIEPGLGANDAPGNTHLLRVQADNTWWASLADKAMTLLEADTLLSQTNNIES